MYLILALCLLCSWVAPHACRSVDTREPPSEDLEPFMTHHHHEGNIAELLIPLLERSLAQSEARDNERAHRRSKGKKVIQVLPYRGSKEHERKGWRKLNSRKKQVVEITPLHGKNGAKPLAYILSAAKPKHADHVKTNDDVSSSNTSELEHDKSTSEEQQSSEEKENSEDINANTLRADDVDSRSASNNEQSSEDANSKESKDLSASDKESDDATVESDATAEKSEEKKVVVIEENEDETVEKLDSVQRLIHDHLHNLIVPASEEAATVEEDAAPLENERAASEDVVAKVENAKPYSAIEDKDAIIEDVDATIEADATVEAKDATAESRAATIEDVGDTVEDVLTLEEKTATVEDVEVTVEDRTVTVEDVEVTVEDKAATIEEEQTTVEDNATVEGKTDASEDDVAVTVEDQLAVEDGERSAATIETDATIERAATAEDATVESPAAIEGTRRNVVTDVPDIYDLLKHHQHIEQAATIENEDSVDNDHGYIENDIVISRGGHHESNSADKSINKLFNARARDIIELIQSSVEASTAPQRDCLENVEKHHDHKSYRLSFLFNK